MLKAPAALSHDQLRRVSPRDMEAVVAIDAALSGRTRRDYFERRLRAAQMQPDFHLQYAMDDAGHLVGYVFARRMGGEFGRDAPALRLEAIGVKSVEQGHGVGLRLIGALESEARKRGIQSLRTTAPWRDDAMLHFLDRAGFELAGQLVLDSAVHGGAIGAAEAAAAAAPESAEVDYGAERGNDFERLARDRADVRTLAVEDVTDICRIDRGITGRDRRAYIARLVDEALNDSAVRVSLTARVDGVIAGFAMARTDFGDFGRSEPVAVLDTLGVDPDYARQGVATALLSQLFVNLQALRIERIETSVDRRDFGLLGFLYDAGFEPSQRLAFAKRLA
jgi:predicted N-acetyltransferase YhbS